MPTLYPHQQKAVTNSPDKWSLFFKMRVGKTATAIRLASTRAKSAIVICPKSIRNQWEREIELWNDSDCKFYVRTKEDMRLHKDIPINADCIIVDECHVGFGNFKSGAFKSLDGYITTYKCKFIWLLTGTPVSSGAWNIFSYKKLLGLNPNWYHWKCKYFFEIPLGHTSQKIQKPKPEMAPELLKEIASIGTIIDLKDITEVPEDEHLIETFKCNALQKKLIKDSFDPLPIVRYTRQHQLESGVLKSDGYSETVKINCDKDKRLKELVEGNDRIVIVCRYINQIEKIVDLLQPLGRKIYQIHGNTGMENGDIALQATQCPNSIVVAQVDSMTGFSLKNFNLMVFASLSFSFVNFEQAKSRLKAVGKDAPNTYIYMLTEGDSIDNGVYKSLMKKQDFDISLFSNKKYEKS